MLDLVRLRHLFEHHGTPLAGQKVIEEARRTAPVRKVLSNSNNVITRVASRKMARFIDTESRTVEYPAAIMYEHDDKVLEYYAQPMKLDLKWQAPGARRPFRIQHTPDFLLIREDGFWVEEWKEESRLQGLSAKNPERIFKDKNGWHFPAVEAHLRNLGISYRLRSADEHPRTFIQNLIFLADYLNPKWPPVEKARLEAIQSQFQDQAALPLLHLLDRGRATDPGKAGENGFTSDDVYKAIADGDLCFDLRDELLSDTHRVLVYRDESAWELGRSLMGAETSPERPEERRDVSIDPGCQVDYDGTIYTVVRVGATTATLQNQESSFDHDVAALVDKHRRGLITIHPVKGEITRTPSFENLPPARVEEILKRKMILDLAETGSGEVTVSDRTLRRYRAMVRKAGENAVDQRIALASRVAERGNRKRKIPDRTLELAAQVAREKYNTARNMNKTTAYKYFLEACDKDGAEPCSMNAFNKELDALVSVQSRKGKRIAYQEEKIVWYLQLEEPVHGVRPFQYVHMDHTQLDLQLIAAESQKLLGKPWLSQAIDAESREIVGFYLSFEAPSYRSCMMLVRDIVRRHGQMPSMLVLDNGKEFHSRALARVCELYGCSLRFRPGGKPRYGSVMERIFGTTNTEFIHQLEGNTQLMKNPRSLTKAVLPENLAGWTLAQLHGALEYYYFQVYGEREHPAHHEPPTEHFKRRMAETGERQHRLVRLDDVFLIETCPPPADTPTRVVDGQRGVKIRHLWFWNDALAKPDLKGQEIEVRVDPWDPGTAFALVKGKWVACRSKLHPILSRYTEVERRYLFEELARQVGSRIGSLPLHRLTEWISVLERRNLDSKRSEQQAEGKAIYEALGMTQAAPAKQPPPEPKAVVPLKPAKAKAPSKSETREKPAVRRGVMPLEMDTDDYSLL